MKRVHAPLRQRGMLRVRLPGAPTVRHFFIEFLIVVAGILVALGVDQWRNGRQELEVANEHLADVTDEVRQNLCTVQRVLALATTERQASLQTVLDFLNDPSAAVPDPAALLQAFSVSTAQARPWLVDNQYQALQNSGDVRLVRKLKPDLQLSAVYEGPNLLFAQVDQIEGDYRVVINELLPAQLQQKDSPLAKYARGSTAPAFVDDADLNAAIAALRARRVELLGLARNEAAVATANWYALTRIKADMMYLLDGLKPWDRNPMPLDQMLTECTGPRK